MIRNTQVPLLRVVVMPLFDECPAMDFRDEFAMENAHSLCKTR